jgi:undecaprenyl-diphosphatase
MLDTKTSALLAQLLNLGRRLLAFVWRHRFSLPLSVLATLCFAELASELQEDELGPFDTNVSLHVQGFRGSADGVMIALTRAGAGLPMAAVGLLCFVLLLVRGRPRDAAFLAVAAGGTGVLNAALKLIFRRARPGGELLYLVDTPSSFSFPSGHAMGSTGVMLSLMILAHVMRVPALLRGIVFVLAAAFVVGVATSRVYLGVHFPSDVIGGQLAGAAWVSAVTGWFYPRLLPGEASGPRP